MGLSLVVDAGLEIFAGKAVETLCYALAVPA